MNKADLTTMVAEKTGLSKNDAEKAISAMMDAVSETLAAGEHVALSGFGTFEVKVRGKRVARNPVTKEEMVLPAVKQPAFRAGASFRQQIAAS